MSPRLEVLTSAAPGAVAVVRVWGLGTAPLCARLGVAPLAEGSCAVRRVLGLDDALLACTSDGLLIMPHGGRAVVRGLVEELLGMGFEVGTAVQAPSDAASWKRHLEIALAGAASPLAIDLLLDQPRRWAAWDGASPLADAECLGRLLRPATVVAVGAPNIGKSSLLNRVAGVSVALAFDRAGTTRDAVGVLVELAGLVVRWVDTPGVDATDSHAGGVVRAACEQADLVLSCTDHHGEGRLDLQHPVVFEVRLRSDRGGSGRGLAVSVMDGTGIDTLTASIRQRLIPDAVIQDPRPWAFWTE